MVIRGSRGHEAARHIFPSLQMAHVAWHLGDDAYVWDTALAASSRGPRRRSWSQCRDECPGLRAVRPIEKRALAGGNKMYPRVWSEHAPLCDREEAP